MSLSQCHYFSLGRHHTNNHPSIYVNFTRLTVMTMAYSSTYSTLDNCINYLHPYGHRCLRVSLFLLPYEYEYKEQLAQTDLHQFRQLYVSFLDEMLSATNTNCDKHVHFNYPKLKRK
jgi:hypothetical protein